MDDPPRLHGLHQFVRPLGSAKEDPCQAQEIRFACCQDFPRRSFREDILPRRYNREVTLPDGVVPGRHIPLGLRSLHDLRQDKGLIGAAHN